MDIKNGLPQFSFLENLQRKPINVITKKIICNTWNINFTEQHGEYDCTVSIYENGEEVLNTECPKCKKEREERETFKEQQRVLEEKLKLCKECNIEPEYYDMTLDDYKPTSSTSEKAKEAISMLINGQIQKVILLGGTGTGKTLLGSIAAKALRGKIYTMYEISTMIRQSYTVKADKTELEIVKELATTPFLAIDEMGRTKGSKAEYNWLSYVLDKRHVRGLPFVLISNAHLRCDCKENGCDNCFENFMDVDVISRLRQKSRIVYIKANDYRGVL